MAKMLVEQLETRSPPGPAAADHLHAEHARLVRENEELAGEVLRCYEQINFIFDVTTQIAVLNDSEQVLRLLLIRLRHMFDADVLYYVPADRSHLARVDRDGSFHRRLVLEPDAQAIASPALSDADIDRVAARLSSSPRVFVDEAADAAGRDHRLWGPLQDCDRGCSAVGILRSQQPFVAGDMLLLDSALTYGSRILGNLRLVDQLKRTSFEAVRALVNAIDQKDPYTAGHSERVGFLARVTGQHVGLPAAQVQELEWAGLLHDIGKIGIPEGVLNKPGRLTPEEFAIIRGHPARSAEVLGPVASLNPVLDGVLYHHENIDGSGYPRGLTGEAIPLSARIIHVVDVFDALTSTRSYRQAFSADKAIAILQQDAGVKLDAAIVQAFTQVWALLPKTHPEQYARWFALAKETPS